MPFLEHLKRYRKLASVFTILSQIKITLSAATNGQKAIFHSFHGWQQDKSRITASPQEDGCLQAFSFQKKRQKAKDFKKSRRLTQ